MKKPDWKEMEKEMKYYENSRCICGHRSTNHPVNLPKNIGVEIPCAFCNCEGLVIV